MAERLTEAVSSLADLFQQQHVAYALIGGLSVAFRGHLLSCSRSQAPAWERLALKLQLRGW